MVLVLLSIHIHMGLLCGFHPVTMSHFLGLECQMLLLSKSKYCVIHLPCAKMSNIPDASKSMSTWDNVVKLFQDNCYWQLILLVTL